MTFENLLERLSNGETFEQIENGKFNVECCNNIVFEDDDFYNFMTSLGVEDIDFGVGYAVFYINNGKIYEVPYTMEENRFDSSGLDETMLEFDVNRIYDVTDNYYYDYEEECYCKRGE